MLIRANMPKHSNLSHMAPQKDSSIKGGVSNNTHLVTNQIIDLKYYKIDLDKTALALASYLLSK